MEDITRERLEELERIVQELMDIIHDEGFREYTIPEPRRFWDDIGLVLTEVHQRRLVEEKALHTVES